MQPSLCSTAQVRIAMSTRNNYQIMDASIPQAHRCSPKGVYMEVIHHMEVFHHIGNRLDNHS